MKKHILINLLIKTLLFGFVFAYVSCSEELYNHEHDEHKRTKKVNLSELPMLQNTINQRKANMRGAEDSLAVYLTLINPENILMVDAPDGSKHYTFSLQINQEEKLTNLVIKEKEEQYDYNLVKYTSDNYQQWITDIKDVGYSTILPDVDVTEFNKFHTVCFIYKWECPWGEHDLSNAPNCRETNLKNWTVTAVQAPCVGETSGGGGSSSGTSGSSSGSSSTGGSSYGGSSGNNYTVITSPTPCTTCPELDNPDAVGDPCAKLGALLGSPQPNIKATIENHLQPNILVNPNGEKAAYLQKLPDGTMGTTISNPTNETRVFIRTGGNYYAAIHTHPNTAYPMFSWSDVYTLYMLHKEKEIHNADMMASFLLVCQDDNDVFQTYAITFDDVGTTLDQFFNNPENIGCSHVEIVREMDKYLENLFFYEDDNNQNYERAFLRANFGFNVSLFKSNSDLTYWSKISINENNITANVSSIPCN